MLHELFSIGQQLLHMIGMGCLLWGTFSMIGAMFGNRSPLDYVKGTALLIFGVYLVGLMRTL
jgi:hypothetical protein